MGIEIERKFLVTSDAWPRDPQAVHMRQGYLAPGPPASARVRIEGERAFLNIKESTLDIRRAEFEYEIPRSDAEEILRLHVGSIVSKSRHRVPYGSHVWEVDVFDGDNSGLVLAEVELEREDEAVTLPPWAGSEVSRDPRYRNTYLCQHPFRTWGDHTAA